MKTNSTLAAFDAVGRLDDLAIRARGLDPAADADELQHRLLEAQLDCVEALVARGLTARAAIQLVALACAEADADVEGGS